MYDSSSRPPRTQGLKERLGASKPTKNYLRLPEAARTILSIVHSSDTFFQIIGRFGGCTLHIPAKWPPNGYDSSHRGHPLRKVLSPRQMNIITAHYGGTDLYIPKCTKFIQQLRNKAIIRAFSRETMRGKSTGETVQWLARRYRLSDRRIWEILKNDLENSPS